MPLAGQTAEVAVTKDKQCHYVSDDGIQCNRRRLTTEHCWAHYQQGRRGSKLHPIQERRDLEKLTTGSIRVETQVAQRLHAFVKAGGARSLYEATRQAITEGMAVLERKFQKKQDKKPAEKSAKKAEKLAEKLAAKSLEAIFPPPAAAPVVEAPAPAAPAAPAVIPDKPVSI